MTSVEFELEPHEYGVVFKWFTRGAIAIDKAIITLLEHTIQEEFKGHRKVTNFYIPYGIHVYGQKFEVDNKKGSHLDIIFNPGISDEEANEMYNYLKYSDEWNELWNDIKTIGSITLNHYDKDGNKTDFPENLLKRIQKCINKSIDAYTHFLI